MLLGPGSRLDAYELLEPLGAGGMGEVWLASDIRLGRRVALKLLPVELTRDPSRVSRFEQEAKAASALNHPNVCTIHALGETADGQHYIAMEYVEGETLRRRIAGGRLTTRASLDIAVQIASALSAAHANGIVHRDIKPENVIIRPDGFVKVLDFGVAKLLVATQLAASEATHTAFRTEEGVVVGTAAYMSPEQARGQEVDGRTDLWSLGCAVYEMVAGRSPFAGSSSSDTLAAILDRDPPPLARFEPDVPSELQRIVAKALRKDRSHRYQTAQDFLLDLEALREQIGRSNSKPDAAEAATTPAPRSASSPRTRPAAVAGVLALGLALLTTAVWWQPREPPVAPATSVGVQRTLARLTFDSGLQTDPSFSPDGRMIAFASQRSGNFDIYVQHVTGGDPVQVTRSPAADTQPSWSPDGSTIAFRSERNGGGIYAVPALGGPERQIADHGSHPAWSPDGSEVWFAVTTFGNSSIILRAVPLQGGPAREILPEFTSSGEWQWIAPMWDGRVSFLGRRKAEIGFFTISEDRILVSDLKALPASLKTVFDERSALFDTTRFEWNRTGTALLLEARSAEGIRNLWKVDVDPVNLAWTRVERLTTGPGDDVAASFSADGTRVVFSMQQASEQLWEYALAAEGLKDGRPLTQVGESALGVDASDDGNTVAFQLLRPGGSPKFWLIRRGEPPTEIAGAAGLGTKLSRDGKHVAYLKLRPDTTIPGRFEAALAIRPLDGTERQIGPWARGFRTPSDWSLDGSSVLTGWRELRSWPADGTAARDHSRIVLSVPEGNLWQGRYSPDGRWLSFVNNQGQAFRQRSRIGVASAEGPERRPWVRIAADRDWVDKPRWSKDGKTLYFLANEGAFLEIWKVAFDLETGRPASNPARLTRFDSPSFRISPSVSTTDWTVAGGKAFVTMTATAGNVWMLDNVDR